jgi:hypothetical protein
MHTLVMVPAMISCLRPVAFTAATNSGLSQALISPLRATYWACGAFVDLRDQRAVRALRHRGGGDHRHLASAIWPARGAARR